MKLINQYIDHTQLNPTATPAMIQRLCREAVVHQLYAVCVHGAYVSLAVDEVKETPVKVAAVVGFPLGAMSTATKVFEAKDCLQQGADELDLVINLGVLKSGDYKRVSEELKILRKYTDNKIIKVIIETCYLTGEEKQIACELVADNGADFVKTSTGFGSSGATLADVKLMKQVVGNRVKIKAAGGIRDYATAIQFIEAGADRIGTSSGVKIVQQKDE